MSDTGAPRPITFEDIREGFREMARRIYADRDRAGRGEAVVYVFAFENGVVKVGQTTDWDSRRNAHRSNERVRGFALQHEWWQRTSSALEDERELLRIAGDLGAERMSGGREWLVGVDPLALIARAEAELVAAPRPPLVFTDNV